MAGFAGADDKELIRRWKEFHFKPWLKGFKLREDINKRPDGSYDVEASLDVSAASAFTAPIADGVPIKEYIRFNKVNGDFYVSFNMLFVTLPRIVEGNIIITGDLRDNIEKAGCKVNGKVIVELQC